MIWGMVAFVNFDYFLPERERLVGIKQLVGISIVEAKNSGVDSSQLGYREYPTEDYYTDHG